MVPKDVASLDREVFVIDKISSPAPLVNEEDEPVVKARDWAKVDS